MGRFFHVEDFVDGQRTGLTETFAAFATFKRFLFAVNVPANKTIYYYLYQNNNNCVNLNSQNILKETKKDLFIINMKTNNIIKKSSKYTSSLK